MHSQRSGNILQRDYLRHENHQKNYLSVSVLLGMQQKDPYEERTHVQTQMQQWLA